MKKNGKIMCPSSKAQIGAQLLGVRQEDGTVAILPQPLRIDESFIEKANEHAHAEQRFRFTNKCIASGCAQWTGSRCGVADRVQSLLEHLPINENIIACAIRPQCRWYLQNGKQACQACPFVITETTAEEWLLSEQTHTTLQEKMAVGK
jgi:hypothetical protein